MQNEPQLTAKIREQIMEAVHHEVIYGNISFAPQSLEAKIDQLLATALEEQRLRYIEQVEEMINTKYPLNRFTDSYTGIMSRGKQMPTSVVPLSPDDEEAVSFLEFILNQLKGQK